MTVNYLLLCNCLLSGKEQPWAGLQSPKPLTSFIKSSLPFTCAVAFIWKVTKASPWRPGERLPKKGQNEEVSLSPKSQGARLLDSERACFPSSSEHQTEVPSQCTEVLGTALGIGFLQKDQEREKGYSIALNTSDGTNPEWPHEPAK